MYDAETQDYIQKTHVEEAEKYSRLQGLGERIEDLESPEAEDPRDDLLDLEARLDEAPSA